MCTLIKTYQLPKKKICEENKKKNRTNGLCVGLIIPTNFARFDNDILIKKRSIFLDRHTEILRGKVH